MANNFLHSSTGLVSLVRQVLLIGVPVLACYNTGKHRRLIGLGGRNVGLHTYYYV